MYLPSIFNLKKHALPTYSKYQSEFVVGPATVCVCGNVQVTYSLFLSDCAAMYESGEGLFLFVGFSQAEEELLNAYTHMSVVDTLPRLQALQETAALTVNEVRPLNTLPS